MKRPKILMVAYACNPEAHGEHWLGWGWAEQAAQIGEVHLLTPTWAREAVERHAERHGIRPWFPEVSPRLLRLTAPLGNTGLWVRQYPWQKQAAALAAQLHVKERFDIVHQTTFHTFRVPFRCAWLGIPAVWGPIAGGESTPRGFSAFLGSARRREAIRPFLNRLSLALPAVQRSLRAARTLFVSNQTTYDFLPAWSHSKARIVPPNAVREDQLAAQPAERRTRAAGEPISLLFLGNLIAIRSIPLVLAAMRSAQEVPARLMIAGDGPALGEWRREVARLGLGDRVSFPGRVALAELPALYAQTDALVFPSLRDSGGSSLVEAMSLGVPVICLDWAGPAEIVSHSNGIKVPVTDPQTTIRSMAEALRRLWAEPEWGLTLGAQAAHDIREKFSWARKRALLEEVYADCLRPAESAAEK
jgi:glycosyltransferase involved in cell wall biosynthesis